MPFADGSTASQKAYNYGSLLLNGQFYYQSGGYLVQGSNATSLSAVLDRVTVRWDADNGLTEEVDFTNERAQNVSVGIGGYPIVQLPPEREFDRRSQLDALFSGQDALRQEVNQLRLSAAVLRNSPQLLATLVDTFHRIMGLDAPPSTIVIAKGPANAYGSLTAGTPLFRQVGTNNPVMPNQSLTVTNPEFVGVTVMDNDSSTGGVRVTRTGDNNVVQARVMVTAPMSAGATVGLGTGGVTDYLVASPTLTVGTLQEDLSQLTSGQLNQVYLCRITVAGAGGGGGDPVWLP